METYAKNKFLALWKHFFNNAELPLTFQYTDAPSLSEIVTPGSEPPCLIAALVRARAGYPMTFEEKSVGCAGGKHYLGFNPNLAPHFEHFLSTGLPGRVEAERYKKTPEIVRRTIQQWPSFTAPTRYITFKRWDILEETDFPEVVVFFAEPDVLSGLFTLAGFDETMPEPTRAPFGSGCSTIVTYPYLEAQSERPRCVLGMFDVSARPYVPANTLSFAVPMAKFETMVENMGQSFLVEKPWAAVQQRIK
ncbi:MAG TPA: hypothetical protein ENN69_07085 [Spirochaetia bacterium]|nr:hypothetical protein [Spirochaetia bacterium]